MAESFPTAAILKQLAIRLGCAREEREKAAIYTFKFTGRKEIPTSIPSQNVGQCYGNWNFFGSPISVFAAP
jgi:hypothetical protein